MEWRVGRMVSLSQEKGKPQDGGESLDINILSMIDKCGPKL